MTSKSLTVAELKHFPQYKKFDNGKEFVFIHIPKTGGTSVRKNLDFPKTGSPKYKFKKHYTYKEMQQLLPASILENAFVFAFVRNPWDRLFSAYHFHKRKNLELNPEQIKPAKRFDTFEAWVRNRDENTGMDVQNLRPQLSWIQDKDGQNQADFIGRFENISADISLYQPDAKY